MNETTVITFPDLLAILCNGVHEAQDLAIEFGWTNDNNMYLLMPIYRLN